MATTRVDEHGITHAVNYVDVDGRVWNKSRDSRGHCVVWMRCGTRLPAIMHRVIHGAENRGVGGVDITTACDLRYNMIPRISLRKRGDVDCMGCLVKDR